MKDLTPKMKEMVETLKKMEKWFPETIVNWGSKDWKDVLIQHMQKVREETIEECVDIIEKASKEMMGQIKTLFSDSCELRECEAESGECSHMGIDDFIESLQAVRKEAQLELIEEIPVGSCICPSDDESCGLCYIRKWLTTKEESLKEELK